MKKTVLFLSIFLILTSNHLPAQSVTSYGLKLGLTRSTYKWIPQYAPAQVIPDIRNSNSINVGVYGELSLGTYLSILPQLEYVNKGARIVYQSPNIPDFTTSHEYFADDHITYVSLPLLLKVKVSSSKISPYLIAGPRLDYLIDKKLENVGYRVVYDNLKQFVLGSSFGIGIQTYSAISIEARYNVDVTNSFHDSGIELYNKSFDVWIGVTL